MDYLKICYQMDSPVSSVFCACFANGFAAREGVMAERAWRAQTPAGLASGRW